MVSPRAQREWAKWKDRLDHARTQATCDSLQLPVGSTSVPNALDGLHAIQDTVGAVAWDVTGDLAAGVSRFERNKCAERAAIDRCAYSGGLLLKLPGRIGEVGMFYNSFTRSHLLSRNVRRRLYTAQGVGLPKQPHVVSLVSMESCRRNSRSALTIYTGAGEYITRMSLARTICKAIEDDDEADTHDILQRILGVDFVGTPSPPVPPLHLHIPSTNLFTAPTELCSKRGEPAPNVGVLLLVKERADEGQHKGKFRPRPAFKFSLPPSTRSIAAASGSMLCRTKTKLCLRMHTHAPPEQPVSGARSRPRAWQSPSRPLRPQNLM